MKRLSLFIVIALFLSPLLMAGGLKTNTNQSAAWARTLTREASTGVDAVYFNPAGLAHLKKGLSLSVSNQSIFQTRTITSTFGAFSDPAPNEYEAELQAPLYPSVYAAFKMEKLTISAGFNLIGGGGTADFQSGLPSIEMLGLALPTATNAILTPVDLAVESITGVNPMFATTQGYTMDMAFSGSSLYMGFQVGATYAINDMISVAIGGRYVNAKNTYEGSMNAMIYPPAHMGTEAVYPGDYIRTVATQVGMESDQTLQGYATLMDGLSKDAGVNTVQTGHGFTPIIGVNVNLLDWINVGAKYEHHTKIELENETTQDLPSDYAMFPDGEKTRGDLPGMFSLGAELSPVDKLVASVGFNYFLDKGAYYGVTNDAGEQINNELTIDENAWTVSASLQYRMIGPLGISAGFSTGNLGVNDSYQSDMSYANKSTSIAGGLFFELGELLIINAGYVHVMYDDYEKELADPMMGPLSPWSETYGKKTGIFAIGVDIML